MNDITEHEAENTAGGLTGVEVTVILAFGTFIVSNWSEAKKGFADGFLTGYNWAQQ